MSSKPKNKGVKRFDAIKSKTVLRVFFKDGVGTEGRTFYSDWVKDTKDPKNPELWKEVARDMVERLIRRNWNGKYRKAMLYANTQPPRLLQYWVDGKLLHDKLD